MLHDRYMSKRNTDNPSVWITTIFGIISPCLLVYSLLALSWCFYQSRSAADINTYADVTTLPTDMKNVLGAEVGPSMTPEVSIKIPIFLYHYVEYVKNDPGKQNLNIPPDILTEQIETLKNDGYTFISPNDLGKVYAKKITSKKIVMLTFDDGYEDFYTDVFPILKKENVKAVQYVIPDLLDRPNYLFTFQLKELAQSPLVEIGAHTMDHVWLQGISSQSAAFQIAQSREVLQDMLHVPVQSFAYPYGAFDQQAIRIVKAAGFTNAISTLPGITQTKENRYFLHRLRPGYRTGKGLLDFLAQDTFKPW